MVDNNDNLMREIQEEVRKEKLAKLWDKYGIFVIGLVAIFVAGIGAFQLYKGRQASLATEGGTLYSQAQDELVDGKTEEALKAFETIENGGHSGYSALAGLQLAGADLKAGKQAEAKKKFDVIANDASADPILRNFAILQSAALDIGKAGLPEIKNRLNTLAEDDNPWRHYAWELLGMAAYENGDVSEATTYFNRVLGAADAPPGVSARVKVLMGTIVSKTLAKASPSLFPAASASQSEGKKGTTPDAKKEPGNADASSAPSKTGNEDKPAAAGAEPATKEQASGGTPSKNEPAPDEKK